MNPTSLDLESTLLPWQIIGWMKLLFPVVILGLILIAFLYFWLETKWQQFKSWVAWRDSSHAPLCAAGERQVWTNFRHPSKGFRLEYRDPGVWSIHWHHGSMDGGCSEADVRSYIDRFQLHLRSTFPT